MALVKYRKNPWNNNFPTFNNFFDDFFNDFTKENTLDRFDPQVDIIEHKKYYELNLALPGFNKEDINIEIKEGYLTIKGERKYEKKEEEAKYHRTEIGYGTFTRSFHLPEGVDHEEINAKHKNGILQVKVNKIEKNDTTKVINIG